MSVHVGDIGSKIQYEGDIDISAASVLVLKYIKPNGDRGQWVATAADDYTLEFETTVITDLDQSGIWKLQAYVEILGWKGHSDIREFPVDWNVN